MLNQLENGARAAKHANSFREYKAGEATKEYNEYCERANIKATRAIEKLKGYNAPSEKIDKVNILLERYKADKLQWLIEYYNNSASVPSMMISGGGNFPVRRKEKQLAREKTINQNNPDYLLEKIDSIAYGAHVIKSDDVNAVERIKAKINSLQGQPDPYGNVFAEIRRLKARLYKLEPDNEEFKEIENNTTVNGVSTYEEIIALWDNTKVKQGYQGRFYIELPLVFHNGKRRYNEYVASEVNETGDKLEKYNFETRQSEFIPLTDEMKFNIIISKIAGSGNKKVMYNYLKSLSPEFQEQQSKPKETSVTINGEAAEVVRDTSDMRLRLVFNGIPEVETRNLLKSNGFRWSPKNTAWQRLLNDNAEYALNKLMAI